MGRSALAIGVFILALTSSNFSDAADWSERRKIPSGGVSNPFGLAESELPEGISAGRGHGLRYPVGPTGLLLPYEALKNFYESNDENLLRRWLRKLMPWVAQFKSFDQMAKALGLYHYPESEGDGAYYIPYPEREGKPSYRMGITLREIGSDTAFTVSCAGCHAEKLFGRPILGLTTRFPRANEFFVAGTKTLTQASSFMFRMATGATDGEIEMFERSKYRSQFIGSRKPQVLGLDTSLAQVALSVAHRNPDEYLTFSEEYATNPRSEPLAEVPADSKPAVWWNVKYKNRYLSDGSVVSGNPVFTNFLWNEIGRGADLYELESWLGENEEIVEELTTAVFSAEAPKFTDFFPVEHFDLDRVQRGERIYVRRCSKCHGEYEKGYHQPGSESGSLEEQLTTVQVHYLERTPVKNVGTDPLRWQGMRSLLALNQLAISSKHGTVIKAQKGYVPPPLVGIWARWPYMHNNSMPSLCAVLTRSEERPKAYWPGPANDPGTDFDKECNGYPLAENVPAHWKQRSEAFYDTARAGMSSIGHDENIFIKNGKEILSTQDKRDLILYMQTL
ncbi:MAG: hypothetical protein H6626_04785 [Pseudobdellovibrionaceae bacterium]|nr:hypothetical protein [Bdellovibrionales bacterium]USN48407.1 MAG: hypothetical protein H6626_04785 [Pseudobdellovibrionaceae bacterium]